MIRLMQVLALALLVAFAAAGCVRPERPARTAAGKRNTVTRKNEPEKSATRKADAKPAKDEPTSQPAKPDAKPQSGQPERVPPERAESEAIEADDVGIPIYPGAEVVIATRLTWVKTPHPPMRVAWLTSTDPPDEILRWYRGKLGGDAKITPMHRQPPDKGAFIQLVDPQSRIVRMVSVTWTAEEPGVATDTRVRLEYKEPPKTDSGG